MPRPVQDQVVVITGASSGIGREAALLFAEKGAALVLAARNVEALQEVAREVQERGGRAHVVPTDVGEWDQVVHLVNEAVNYMGRIDTWVNDAAIAEYASLEDMTPDEIERLIHVDLIGLIFCCKAAIPAMKQLGGGTIINVASVAAEVSIPLLSVYSAAKHGVKGFSDALRLEMKHEGTNIDVTTIYPSSINTPFFEHARSKLGVMPKPIPPVYQPYSVAQAIVHAAEHPRRDVYVGGAGVFYSWMAKLSPNLTDMYMLQNSRMWKQQMSDRADDHQDNLYQPSQGMGFAKGLFGEGAAPFSAYTQLMEEHPNAKRLLVASLAALTFALVRRSSR